MSFPRIFVGAVAALSLAACHRPQQMDEHKSHMAAGDLAATSVAASNNQGNPALPPSANQAAARLAASNRHGEWVKIAWRPGSSDSLMAWVVYPATSNPRTPVVVVVHEIFGLQTWVRGVADQVAADGFIAIAPDLLSRVRGGASTVSCRGIQPEHSSAAYRSPSETRASTPRHVMRCHSLPPLRNIR